MTDATDNLVLEHLRTIRAEIGDLKLLVVDQGQQVNNVRRDLHTLHGDVLRHDERFSRLELRLEKIERRLGLLDA